MRTENFVAGGIAVGFPEFFEIENEIEDFAAAGRFYLLVLAVLEGKLEIRLKV